MAPDTIELSIRAVADFEAFLSKNQTELMNADLSSLTEYISWLIKEGLNSEEDWSLSPGIVTSCGRTIITSTSLDS